MPSEHRIRTGIGGWTFGPWRGGTFYPPGLPHSHELAFTSRRLPAIEINGTFYGAQKPATFAKWRSETPEGFLFSLKASRYCTHRRVLADAGESVRRFVGSGITELAEKLGPIVWQFMPTTPFNPDDMAAFIDLLPTQQDGLPLRHVLEVRHASFRDLAFIALARQRGCAIVFTDSDKHPCIPDITADFVYARLMRASADEATGYSAQALDHWTSVARTWSEGGRPDGLPYVETTPTRSATPRDVFVYFINGAKERAPAAAGALLHRLGIEPLQ